MSNPIITYNQTAAQKQNDGHGQRRRAHVSADMEQVVLPSGVEDIEKLLVPRGVGDTRERRQGRAHGEGFEGKSKPNTRDSKAEKPIAESAATFSAMLELSSALAGAEIAAIDCPCATVPTHCHHSAYAQGASAIQSNRQRFISCAHPTFSTHRRRAVVCRCQRQESVGCP